MADAKEWEVIGMTVDEAAAALRVDRKTILKALKAEGLPARKVGRGYRIDYDAVKSWLATGSVSGNEAEQEEE